MPKLQLNQRPPLTSLIYLYHFRMGTRKAGQNRGILQSKWAELLIERAPYPKNTLSRHMVIDKRDQNW